MPPKYPYYQPYPYSYPQSSRRRKTARTNRKAYAMHCPNCGDKIPDSLLDNYFSKGDHKKKPTQSERIFRLTPSMGWKIFGVIALVIAVSMIASTM
jgi:hypothetical protein